MTVARKLSITKQETAPTSSPDAAKAQRLVPTFRIELRRRHSEDSPIDELILTARTLASARHAARLARPDCVILSVTRI